MQLSFTDLTRFYTLQTDVRDLNINNPAMYKLIALNNADDISENLETSLSTQPTLASQGSFQSLANTRSHARALDHSLSISTTERNRSQVGNYTRRSSRLYKRYHINLNRKRPNSSNQSSSKDRFYSKCISPEEQGVGGHHLESILQRLSETAVNQDRLLTLLHRTHDKQGSLTFPFSHVHVNHSRPNPIKFSPSSLQKYVQNTLHPDSVRLCDMFLARYNLPHVLSGSYDPIELIHAHGWEQEGCGETTLVIQDPSEDAQMIEVPWKHID